MIHPEFIEWMQLLRQAQHSFLEAQDAHAVHLELVERPGDVPVTYADSTALERDFGFTPKITLREGLRKFAEWYADYYGTKA